MKSLSTYRFIFVCLAFLFVIQIGYSKTIFVDAAASAGGDGLSWATAYRFLQDALGDASNGDEIWVAAGAYKPDQSEANPSGAGLREDTFTLTSGIRLIGGLSGSEDTATFHLEDRAIESNQTILSGDLLGDDDNTLTGAALLTDTHRSENSYHVLKGTGVTNSTVIDGFTITGGAATGTTGDYNKGGGLLNGNNSNPQLLNCTFIRNTAQWGAVLYNYRSSSYTDNCRFLHNASTTSGGVIHNGVSLVEMEITNSVFENNLTEGWGGAIYNNNSGLMRLDHCRVINNTAWKYGNTRGGAFASENNSQVTLEFCTVAGNTSDNEGGAIRNDNSTLTLSHCILWDNEDDSGPAQSAQIHNAGGSVTVDYSCVMGWDGTFGGSGNFSGEPFFVDLPGGDVHLKSQSGHWDETSRDWILDTTQSSCIDAGDSSLWIEDEPRGSGGRINIGAYGGTSQASKEALCVGGIDGNGLLYGDANRDCKINMTDLALLASDWMRSTIQYY